MIWRSLMAGVLAVGAAAAGASSVEAGDPGVKPFGGAVTTALGTDIRADTVEAGWKGRYYGGYSGARYYSGYSGARFYGSYYGARTYGGHHRHDYPHYYPRTYSYYAPFRYHYYVPTVRYYDFYRPYYYAPPVYYNYDYCPSFGISLPSFSVRFGGLPAVSGGVPAVNELPAPAPLTPPPPADGTFPYDGGPRSPVPMPKEEAAPLNAPPAPAPADTRPVSLTNAKPSKFSYPAYGETATRPAATGGRVLTVKTPPR